MEEKVREGVLCFIVNEDKVLLVLTEYSTSDRKWNGISGFVEEGESLEDAVIRETEEETYLRLDKNSLKEVAELNINNELQLHVFTTSKWEGEQKAKDPTLKEFRWFPKYNLPLNQMHEGNYKWLPLILEGKLVKLTNGKIQEEASF